MVTVTRITFKGTYNKAQTLLYSNLNRFIIKKIKFIKNKLNSKYSPQIWSIIEIHFSFISLPNLFYNLNYVHPLTYLYHKYLRFITTRQNK